MSKIREDAWDRYSKTVNGHKIRADFDAGWDAALKAAADRLENAPSELFTQSEHMGLDRAAEMLRDPELAWPDEKAQPDDEPADFTEGNY